jgi:hypothetical protein
VPDYTSLVPKYDFPSDTIKAQEAALAVNPLLQRLHAARAAFAGDRLEARSTRVSPSTATVA